MKRFNTITAMKDINSDHWRNFYGSICQWVGLLVGIALSGTSLLPSLVTVITRTSFKNFTVKQEKTMPLSCLPGASQTAQPVSFRRQCKTETSHSLNFTVFTEVEKYLKLKADISNQAKANAKQIMKEQ